MEKNKLLMFVPKTTASSAMLILYDEDDFEHRQEAEMDSLTWPRTYDKLWEITHRQQAIMTPGCMRGSYIIKIIDQKENNNE